MNEQGLSRLQPLLNVWTNGVKKVDIVNIEFEKEMKLTVKGQTITLTCFRTEEYGNVKFGIDAPRRLSVDRQEIYEMKKSNDNMRVNDERKAK